MVRVSRCLAFGLLLLFLPLGCSDDSPTDVGDTTPPARVMDLTVVSAGPATVRLAWTTPGDNGSDGRASQYEVRASQTTLTDDLWESSTLVDAGRPLEPGAIDSATVSGLTIGAWSFAVRVADEVPNWSPISNVPIAEVQGTPPPTGVDDLRVVSETASSVLLAWTAPSTEGGNAAYDLRFALMELSEQTWDAGTEVDGEPVPGSQGVEEMFLVSGLDPATTYSFGVKTANTVPNWSELSNVVEARTSRTVRLTTSNRLLGAREPDWSSDGETVAFVADWGSQFALRLYLVPAEGGATSLFSQIDFARFPSWSPSSDELAFLSEREGNDGTVFELSVVDATPGASPRILSSHDPLDVGDIAWSPDGTRIAYEVILRQFPPLREIYVVPADGGEPRLVVGEDLNGGSPAWSPDGSKLAIAASGGSSEDIWVVDVDSGSEQQITSSEFDEITPAWSPDGTRLAYASNKEGNYDIWVATSAGLDPVRLTTEPGEEFSPVWSPDGDAIVFVRGEGPVTDLWTIYSP